MDSGSPSPPVVVLITPYYHPIVGGVTTFVAGLADELVRRGAEVTVLTHEGAEAPGVRRGPSRAGAFVRWCRHAVREIRPDVIHGHGHWYCLAGAVSPLGRRLAPRVVMTVHTVPEVPRLRRIPFRRLIRRADVVTFVSESSRRAFVDRFGPVAQSAVVFPGVRQLSLVPAASQVDGPNRFRISAMGVMSWARKVDGMRLLLEATARLRRDVPGVSLTLAGDGELRSDLEALSARLGLTDRVRFPGMVQDPGRILSESDVFCHISSMDSFPQAIIEAMSASLPVVVNDGAMDRTVFRGPDCGVIFCRASVEGVVEALCRMASSPADRRRLGLQGRAFVSRVFSWRNQGQRFWEIYGLDRRASKRDDNHGTMLSRLDGNPSERLRDSR